MLSFSYEHGGNLFGTFHPMFGIPWLLYKSVPNSAGIIITGASSSYNNYCKFVIMKNWKIFIAVIIAKLIILVKSLTYLSTLKHSNISVIGCGGFSLPRKNLEQLFSLGLSSKLILDSITHHQGSIFFFASCEPRQSQQYFLSIIEDKWHILPLKHL